MSKLEKIIKSRSAYYLDLCPEGCDTALHEAILFKLLLNDPLYKKSFILGF